MRDIRKEGEPDLADDDPSAVEVIVPSGPNCSEKEKKHRYQIKLFEAPYCKHKLVFYVFAS